MSQISSDSFIITERIRGYNYHEKMVNENITKAQTIDEKISVFYADRVFGMHLHEVPDRGRREIDDLIRLVKNHYEAKNEGIKNPSN